MIIKLINMPFADVAIPSIALTQLKSVLKSDLQDKVEVDIHYFNHELADYLTLDNYRFISNGGQSNNSGFGDWFFRQQAFPHIPDNTQEYLSRYGHLLGMDFLQQKGAFIQEKRQQLDQFLENLIDKYELDKCDIVGFTSMFMQNVGSFAMARKIKERNKDVTIVMGGANCESPMGEELVKNFEMLDFVFSGTSLISFPRFVKSLMTGNRSEAETINGVFSRANTANKIKDKAQILVKEDGEVETVGPIGEELSINECVPLDYDSFLESFDYFFKGKDIAPSLLFETSRGCWWGARAHCTFCGLNGGGMSYRAMKSEIAISMINDLIDRYGDRVKNYSCVDNIIPKEYIREVFPYVKKLEGMKIFYEVRADITSEEMDILSNAGVVEMQPGIESLATSTLKLMKKGTTSFNNLKFLQRTVLYSVLPQWNLLVGFPGEKEEVYAKYVNDLPSYFHLPPPIGVFPVRFDRYSPYYMEADAYNLDLEALDYYTYTYPKDKETLKEMAYYFGDQNYEADYIRITAKWLSKLEILVSDWNKRWRNFDKDNLPVLHFGVQDGKDIVIDQRGERKIIPLTETQKNILINLEKQKSLKGIQSQLKEYDPNELESELSYLLKIRLLHEENGTYMSLVFDENPSEQILDRLKYQEN
ncbi:MAG: RiPP maturation radical SAM C-methyltransferase [Cytophagales bacterium]|nr:RiPP maturation radical SAM C-methyltransferase [Cytophagales bacterium]